MMEFCFVFGHCNFPDEAPVQETTIPSFYVRAMMALWCKHKNWTGAIKDDMKAPKLMDILKDAILDELVFNLLRTCGHSQCYLAYTKSFK